MITAVVIENFKGIGERFRLPIKPLTLLFGPNSAGKSTILQAIHYAREVLEHRNLDATRALSGGSFVELGGFHNFVHNRDLRRRVTLRFEMKLEPWQPLPPFWIDQWVSDETKKLIYGYDEPTTAAVEFSVAWSERGLYVSSYSVDLDGVTVARMTADTHQVLDREDGRSVYPARIDLNLDHPILKSLDPVFLKLDSERGEDALNPWISFTRGEGVLEDWPYENVRDALPDLQKGLFVFCNGMRGDDSPVNADVLDGVLSRLIVGPAVILAKELAGLRYLGPLREVPGPGYAPPQVADANRWVTGLAAWDILHTCEPSFVELVSEWMLGNERLATGYGVRQCRYSELGFDDELRKRILSCEAARHPQRLASDIAKLPVKTRVRLFKPAGEGDVLPQDVGMGMSQLLPIVVACCAPGGNLTCIEQPELHLHPRVQCELADLLISGALNYTRAREPLPEYSMLAHAKQQSREKADQQNGSSTTTFPRTLIIETHSEHLLLRLLRRVRETTAGAPHNGTPITPDDLSVCYVNQEDGQSVPRTIRVDGEGEFIDRWPKGFFEERATELFS